MEIKTVKMEAGSYNVLVNGEAVGAAWKVGNKWQASCNGATISGKNGTWDAYEWKTLKAAAEDVASHYAEQQKALESVEPTYECPICHDEHGGSRYKSQRADVCVDCTDQVYHNAGFTERDNVTDADIRKAVESAIQRKEFVAKFEPWLMENYRMTYTDFNFDMVIRERFPNALEEGATIGGIRRSIEQQFRDEVISATVEESTVSPCPVRQAVLRQHFSTKRKKKRLAKKAAKRAEWAARKGVAIHV